MSARFAKKDLQGLTQEKITNVIYVEKHIQIHQIETSIRKIALLSAFR